MSFSEANTLMKFRPDFRLRVVLDALINEL